MALQESESKAHVAVKEAEEQARSLHEAASNQVIMPDLSFTCACVFEEGWSCHTRVP